MTGGTAVTLRCAGGLHGACPSCACRCHDAQLDLLTTLTDPDYGGPLMTAHPRSRGAKPRGEVAEARARVDTLRRLVATRQAGAAALHVAEYRLQAALDRLAEDDDDGPAAA
ncbi:MAG: hypothetical protein WD250_13165 [Egibacteraceae bacterium]